MARARPSKALATLWECAGAMSEIAAPLTGSSETHPRHNVASDGRLVIGHPGQHRPEALRVVAAHRDGPSLCGTEAPSRRRSAADTTRRVVVGMPEGGGGRVPKLVVAPRPATVRTAGTDQGTGPPVDVERRMRGKGAAAPVARGRGTRSILEPRVSAPRVAAPGGAEATGTTGMTVL